MQSEPLAGKRAHGVKFSTSITSSSSFLEHPFYGRCPSLDSPQSPLQVNQAAVPHLPVREHPQMLADTPLPPSTSILSPVLSPMQSTPTIQPPIAHPTSQKSRMARCWQALPCHLGDNLWPAVHHLRLLRFQLPGLLFNVREHQRRYEPLVDLLTRIVEVPVVPARFLMSEIMSG